MGILDFLFSRKDKASDEPKRDWNNRYLIDRLASPPKIAAPVAPQDIHLTGEGEFEYDIVGESNYQDNLEKIAGPKSEEGCEFECLARLVREPNNRFDSNAIRVDITGLTVGYIPKTETGAFHTVLKKFPPNQALTVDALIVGGWRRSSGSEGSFGVKLDIS